MKCPNPECRNIFAENGYFKTVIYPSGRTYDCYLCDVCLKAFRVKRKNKIKKGVNKK